MPSSERRALRVAYVLDTVAPWSKGGRETRARELIAGLSAAGIDVTTYTMRWWRGAAPPGHVAVCPRVSLYRGGRRSLLQAAMFSLGCLRLVTARFDVIVTSQMPYLHVPLLRLVSFLRRRPMLTDWHELWRRETWEGYAGTPALGQALERISLAAAGGLIVSSEGHAAELRRRGIDPRRCSVVPNGVPRRRFEDVVPAGDAAALLCVGRLLPHKRTDVAIRALSLLGDDTVRLGVIGVGPELDSLRDVAAAAGVADRVSFLGEFEDPAAVWSALAGARAVLFASEREGFGLVVAEALALGTPVICADAPDNDATALIDPGVTGALVPPSSPEAMAAAVREVLAHPRTREAVRDAFWASHPGLDWEVISAVFARLVAQVGGSD